MCGGRTGRSTRPSRWPMLRPGGHPDRRAGRGPAHQDDETRCASPGIVQGWRGDNLARRPRRHDKAIAPSPRARAQAGRWTTAGKAMSRASSEFGFAVDWMARISASAWPRQRDKAQMPLVAAGRPVLRPRAGARRQSLGYVQPDPAAAETLMGHHTYKLYGRAAGARPSSEPSSCGTGLPFTFERRRPLQVARRAQETRESQSLAQVPTW